MNSQILENYKITDLGEQQNIWSNRSKETKKRIMHLNQSEYVEKVLKQYGMIDCKATTSMMVEAKLLKQDSPSTDEERQKMQRIPYQNLIGSLMYLTICTRPDLAFLSMHSVNFPPILECNISRWRSGSCSI
ncbi:hypothetical protein O6H91_19G061400 [Diphasiastrum complanatum]|uniref:Uncharacterized protein n=1 Tax=Diphasiastrum complanatum TaxID=34168 RepID=A0ACC2AVQ8_DIPCM|nr:hypothetical protein O6H91_19G061400 [Diphasiastrum complanatum]